MRYQAHVEKIISIAPIPDADRIEKATILGWEVVVQKKDGFKLGDLVVYIEIDSLLPDNANFEFMRKYKFRVKTIKLKNQVSQGLVIPISMLPNNIQVKEGMDVSEILGITKYDPEGDKEKRLAEEHTKMTKSKITRFFFKNKTIRNLLYRPATGGFPSFIKRTDETRIQNKPQILEAYPDETYVVTEKLDGTSCTFFLVRNPNKLQFWKKYIFGVCSRNIHLKKDNGSCYWKIAKKHNIEQVLRTMINDSTLVVLQGEVIGPAIQKNKYHFQELGFFAFNLLFNGKLVETSEMADLLMEFGIRSVPILDKEFKLPETVSELVDYANDKSVFGYLNDKTHLIEFADREGVVIRNYKHNVSFKVISPQYLLEIEKE